MKIVAGLGNPGPRYAGTRHNIGFEVITRLAAELGIKGPTARHNSLIAKGYLKGEPLFLQQPLTFMNRSGTAVKALLGECGAGPEDLLVIVDDLDLPLGKLRIRAAGGSGGHNGLKSIIETLGSREFARLRIGIGRPLHPEQDVSDYVLEKWTAAEHKLLEPVLVEAVEAVMCALTLGVTEAANRYNRNGTDIDEA